MSKKMSKQLETFLLKFDELNKLAKSYLKMSEDEATSSFEDLLIEGYLLGCSEARRMLGIKDADLRPYIIGFLNHTYQGETVGQKFADYFTKGDAASMQRLMDSEYHRTFNVGIERTADDANWKTIVEIDAFGKEQVIRLIPEDKKIMKTWVTMGDEKVRMTHDFLDGVKVGLYEDFYTFDGDSARYPGDFRLASNNANCRCVISLSLEDRPKEQNVTPTNLLSKF